MLRARELGIDILILPGKSTHFLQPWDQIFGSFRSHYSRLYSEAKQAAKKGTRGAKRGPKAGSKRAPHKLREVNTDEEDCSSSDADSEDFE